MAENKPVLAKGGCLCGGVSFDVRGPLSSVSFCHCKQCRNWHGNFAGYTGCDEGDLVFLSDETLGWFKSSDVAHRGFCKNCGSSLFWSRFGTPGFAVAAGCLQDPTGLIGREHIFMGSAADYYTIDDDLPQFIEDHPSGV